MGKYLGAMLTGQVCRSVDTARAHRAFRDGNGSMDEYNSACSKDSQSYISNQENFAHVSGGQLEWLDLLRPIARNFSGFSLRDSDGEDAIGPITRWFRTNSFYRKPTIDEKINCSGDELAKSLPKLPGNGVLLVLGPYSFAKLVENDHYADEKTLAMDYARAIAKNYASLKSIGYNCVLLLEPSIGYDQSNGKYSFENWYLESISIFKKDMKVGIHLPLCNATPIVPHLDKSNADFLGIDAIYTKPEGFKCNKDILIGIMDGARSKKETVEETLAQLKDFISNSNFSGNYYLGPTDRLYDVPFAFGIGKIKTLSAIANELK
ncbi:hypothetical protein HY989_04510 [Candidatus Micrarchaeota archaeon]|nr:hypothetical protein [Candidatus Micrarchaeota archaeon]